MMKLRIFTLCCTFFPSMIAFTLPDELTPINNSDNLLRLLPNYATCEDDSSCKNGGTCTNNGKLKLCTCLEGTEGPFCENIPDCGNLDCGQEEECVFNIETKTTQCEWKANPCNPNPCMNDGKCVLSDDVPTCLCPDAFIGDKCEKVDPCHSISCQNDGVCYVYGDEGKCSCRIRFIGEFCEKEDPCYSDPCQNGGKCVVSDDKAICVCPEGLKGKFCEEGKCSYDKDCKNGGTCNPYYKLCDCLKGTFGDECERILDCSQGGKYENCEGNRGTCGFDEKHKKAYCTCPEGKLLHPIFGYCAVDNCRRECGVGFGQVNEDLRCVAEKPFGDVKCECKHENMAFDYKDKKCKNKCSQIKCFNGGKCIIKAGKPVCNCTDKFTGEFCQKNLTSLDDSGNQISVSFYLNKSNSLEANSKFDFHFNMKEISNRTLIKVLARLSSESKTPPSNNKCSQITCKNGGICVFENEKSVCNCTDKYTGEYCEKDPEVHDPCSNYPCKNSARCVTENLQAKCICLPGFSGKLCEDDVCIPNHCMNNGTCQRDTGNAICKCTDGYTGDKCEIDKCSLIKCHNGGKCGIRNESAACICNDRYTGSYCETDKCSLITCKNEGKCDVKNEKIICICNEKYIGDFCEVDKCSLLRCLNGGTCEIRNQKTFCVCNSKFTGDFCEKEINGDLFARKLTEDTFISTTTL